MVVVTALGGGITSWNCKHFPSKGGVWTKPEIQLIVVDKPREYRIAALLTSETPQSLRSRKRRLQHAGSQHPDNEPSPPSCSKQADVLAHKAAVSVEASPLMDPLFDWLSNNSTASEFQSSLKESCFSSCIPIELNWKARMK